MFSHWCDAYLCLFCDRGIKFKHIGYYLQCLKFLQSAQNVNNSAWHKRRSKLLFVFKVFWLEILSESFVSVWKFFLLITCLCFTFTRLVSDSVSHKVNHPSPLKRALKRLLLLGLKLMLSGSVSQGEIRMFVYCHLKSWELWKSEKRPRGVRRIFAHQVCIIKGYRNLQHSGVLPKLLGWIAWKSCRIASKSCRIAWKSCRIAWKTCRIASKSCIIASKSCRIASKSCRTWLMRECKLLPEHSLRNNLTKTTSFVDADDEFCRRRATAWLTYPFDSGFYNFAMKKGALEAVFIIKWSENTLTFFK